MTDWEGWALAAELFALTIIGLLVSRSALALLYFAAAALAALERPPFASRSLLWRRYGEVTPAITIISPAYNEGMTIISSTEASLALEYPDFDVIVVNDGSTDDTLRQLIDRFHLVQTARFCEQAAPHAPIRAFYVSRLEPKLIVIDKVNGGSKSDAVNAGINAARTPIICIIDGDTLIDPDALLRSAWAFIEEPLTIAVGGTVGIANGAEVERGHITNARLPRNFLALVQTLEYHRSFMMARLGMSRLKALMIVSGAFGLFRRDAVIEVGGYSLGTVGEDLELVVKLHRHFRDEKRPYAIRFLPRPTVWTQAPESLSDLGRQRARWARGSLETCRKHWQMILNPRYGGVGLIGFSHILLLDVIGPPLVVAGYILVPLSWMLGLLSGNHFFVFLSAVFALGVLTSLLSLILEQVLIAKVKHPSELALLAVIAVVENFGYRQMCDLWRVRGWYQYLVKEERWGPMTRQAFKTG